MELMSILQNKKMGDDVTLQMSG